MRSIAIAAFVAAVNAAPAQFGQNKGGPAAFTVTHYTDVYTTVYYDDPAATNTYNRNGYRPSSVVSKGPAAASTSTVSSVVSKAPVAASSSSSTVSSVVSKAPVAASSSSSTVSSVVSKAPVAASTSSSSSTVSSVVSKAPVAASSSSSTVSSVVSKAPVAASTSSSSTSSVVTKAPATSTSSVASTSSAASTSATVSAAANAPSTYAQSVLAHHNAHRANHSAAALTWDDALAATALKIAKSCVYAHDVQTDGGGYGQNIAAGCPANNVSSVITELFYNNEVNNFASLYGQATPSNINDASAFDSYGHFTQIVWKDTTKVGCATYHCDGGLANTGSNVSPDFTVCNYKSPGNYLGEFATNVLRPLGLPTIHWNSL